MLRVAIIYVSQNTGKSFMTHLLISLNCVTKTTTAVTNLAQKVSVPTKK
jgi:hypothetical protein